MTAAMKNPPHPGLLIADVLESLNISQADAAAASGVSSSAICRVIAGKSAVSAEMAVRLQKTLHLNAELLMKMQTCYSLSQAEKTVDTESLRDLTEGRHLSHRSE